jgi:hypothetical protein
MSSDPDHLDQPPFPELDWEDSEWVGVMKLGSGPGVGLNIHIDEPDASRMPSESQRAAFAYLVERWQNVFSSVLEALLPYYQRIRPRYLDFLEEDAEQLMPELADAKKLGPLIDIRQVFIHPAPKDGVCVGLLFGCTWDEEHGLGVIVHLDQVMEIGGADLAFSWSPETDES